MKVLYESTTNLKKIEKVVRSLITSFDYNIVYIQESKNLAEMQVEEFQASLEVHEMRLKQRNSERE